jgi:peptidylprolyl isomerase
LGFESLPRSLFVRAKLTGITLALLLGAGIAACGGDDSLVPEEAATATPTATAAAANTGTIVAGVSKNTRRKPKIVGPEGDPPRKLIIKDVVRGKGPPAKPGDTLTMQYVGVAWSNGQQFDASWDRGKPFAFKLGAAMVIPGWDKGMAGMRKGGRRVLMVPPELAYGDQGVGGAIGPNETLVFVVDRVK